MARLGGVLQVVLALWSRLGGRMGPFRADLEPEGGGWYSEAVSGVVRPWQGSAPVKQQNKQPDNTLAF